MPSPGQEHRALMRMMRAKQMDRLLKLHQGKWTRHLHGIRKRHESSLGMDTSLALVENALFAVKGGREDFYLVEKTTELPHCEPLCPLHCKECNVCIHSFKCDCLDGGLHNTVCKHVHLIMRIFSPVLTFEHTVSDTSKVISEEQDGQDVVLATSQSQHENFVSQPSFVPDSLGVVEEIVEGVASIAPLRDEVAAILSGILKQLP